MAFQALNKLSPFSSLPPAPSLPSSTSATSNLSQQLLQRPLEVQQTSSKFTFPTQSAPAPAPPPAAASHPSNINNASTFSSSTATSNDMSFDQPEMKRENSAVQRARGHHVRNRLSISTATAALSMTDSESQQPSSPTKDDTATNSTAVSRAKKKKGQKFYCEGYGDCSLSFTRSEHLLRHIRKHTGERPFTCHCGRAFSRLDNLRQHSQTVHADEVIPPDSLAATGTRYQRHVKTDRIRPAGPARSSTTNSNPDEANNGQEDGDEMDFEVESPQSSVEDQQASTTTTTATTHPVPIPQKPQTQIHPEVQQQQQSSQPEAKDRPKARPRSLLLQRHSQTRSVSFQDKPGDTTARDNNPYFRERELIDRYHPYVPATSSAMTTPTSTTFSGFSPVTSPAFSSFNGHGPSSPLSPESPSWKSHSRRSSMPGVPQVNGQNPFFVPQTPSQQRYLPSLSSRLSQAVSPRDPDFSPQSPSKKRERDPEEDNRRRTWHPGTFVGFQPPSEETIQRSGQSSLAPPVPPLPTVTAPPVLPAPASRTVLPSVQSLLNSTPSPPSAFSSPVHSNRNSFVFPQPPVANNPSPMEPSLNSFDTRRGSFTNDFPRFTSENRKSMNLENSPKRHASPPPIPPRLRLDVLHNRTSSWAGPSPTPFSIEQLPERRTFDDSNTPTRDDVFRNHRMSRNGLASNRSSFYGQSPQEHREREGSSEESENSEVAVATPASSVDYEQRYLNYKQVGAPDIETNHRSIMSVSFANNPPQNQQQQQTQHQQSLHPTNQQQMLQNPPPLPQRSFARPRTINGQNSKPGALNEGKENGMSSSLDILAEVARIETNRTDAKMDMS